MHAAWPNQDGRRDRCLAAPSATRRRNAAGDRVFLIGRRDLQHHRPDGVDKGKGGKHLILPLGYKEQLPAGYIVLPSNTYTDFAILRSNLKSESDADVAKAVAYGKRVKFYPLSQAGNPPATKFVDSGDVLFDSAIPYDVRFFEALDRFMQREPWLDRDRVMIDSLKTIGIEKGKPQHTTRRHGRKGSKKFGFLLRGPDLARPLSEGTEQLGGALWLCATNPISQWGTGR